MSEQALKNNYRGGMVVDVEPSRLEPEQYSLLVNGRNLRGMISPVKLPVPLEGVPSDISNIQGLYSADTLLILFADGKAFFRDIAKPNSVFFQIPGLQLDADASRIFLALVPESTANFSRELSSEDISGEVILRDSIFASPRVAVVQDGINQPWLIFPTGTARQAQTYVEWSLDKREYVPIGTNMLYSDGILYITSPNGDQIFRSVTGRPLDFIVAINLNGDKLHESDEARGGAFVTSHRVSYDQITMIQETSERNAIIVSTEKATFFVQLDFEHTIFGEPTFISAPLFPEGAINNFSIADILGDVAIITPTGIQSFNAVSQTRVTSRHSPFSRSISPLLEGHIQDDSSAAANWREFALFSVNTIHGAGVLVFSTFHQTFVALDLYPGVGKIKQFARIRVGVTPRLFFLTEDNLVYEAFVGDTATCRFYSGELSSQDPGTFVKLQYYHLSMLDVKESGEIEVTPYVDRRRLPSRFEEVLAAFRSSTIKSLPFEQAFDDNNKSLVFNSSYVQGGFSIGFLVEWNFDAFLASERFTFDVQRFTMSPQQQSKISPTLGAEEHLELVFLGNDGVISADRKLLNEKIKRRNPSLVVGLGNHALPDGSQAAVDANLVPYWGHTLENSQAVLIPGVAELSTDYGRPFRIFNRHHYRYWRHEVSEDLVLYLLNSGLDNDGNLAETPPLTTTTSAVTLGAEGTESSLVVESATHFFVDDLLEITGVGTVKVTSIVSGTEMTVETIDDSLNGVNIPIGTSLQRWNIDDTSRQALWLKETSAADNHRFKIAVVHEPPFSSDPAVAFGSMLLQWPFSKWGINTVISSNSRTYERFFRNNTHYIVSGLGGALPFGDFVSPHVTSLARFNGDFGFLNCGVGKFSLNMEFRTLNDGVIDKFTITP